MNRLVLFLLSLFSIFLTANAQLADEDIIYINHSDGSCTPIMTWEIDSIVLSNYDKDSVYHDNVQTQVFYTKDKVYRVPLNEIKEVSFKEGSFISYDKVLTLMDDISQIYSQCETLDDMLAKKDLIDSMDNVEKTWTEDGAFFVKVKNGGIVTWSFVNDNGFEVDNITVKSVIKEVIEKETVERGEREYLHEKKMCIINQQSNDESRSEYAENYNKLKDEYTKVGIDVDYIQSDKFDFNFLENELKKYNIIFLITHGNSNAICTGVKFSNDQKDYYNALWNMGVLEFGVIEELRSGVKVTMKYVGITDKYLYFLKYLKQVELDNAIMFNTACFSLNKEKLCSAFLGLGVRAYLGYNNTNSVGKMAGVEFFNSMLWGKSVKEAMDGLEEKYKKEERYNSTLSLKGNGENLGFHLCPDENHPHFIDLGLPSGTLWSCCNLEKDHEDDLLMPESYGGYFAWGETSEKANYNESNYKYYVNGEYVDIGKEIPAADGIMDTYEISGTEYDAVINKRIDGECMPTAADCKEFQKNCRFKWANAYGVNGIFATGPNGKRIFLPAAGFRSDNAFSTAEGFGGHYYLGSQCKNSEKSKAYNLLFSSQSIGWITSHSRFEGCTIRPILRPLLP